VEAHLMRVELSSVTDIDAIKTELWRARQDVDEHDKGLRVATTTMNFVVFINDPDHRKWVLERVEMIADKHPCRTIILDANADRTGADIFVSSLDEAGSTIHGERIELGVPDVDGATLRNIVGQLRVPGVETHLLWSAIRITESARFKELIEIADSIVVDSSGAVRDGSTVAELARFFGQYRHIPMRDLAWMRLKPWRDMVARFFDDPGLREELFSIRKVSVASGSDAEGLYLAGWLGSRLGWKPEHGRAFKDRNGKPVAFELTRTGEPRRVASIALETDTSQYTAAVTNDASTVELRVSGRRAHPPALAPLAAIDNVSLIESAILAGTTDEIFETALRTVGEILA
jgi:glucose-6-phosphate dehydrogenase assembly protein OpcA